MLQRWDDLSFLHWSYAPETVARLLPAGLQVDTIDGAAWVGVVPFRLTIRAPGVPAVPWAGRFAEVNVRTYVRGPDGRPGIWFLSLDPARLGGVMLARHTYRVPYVWARTVAERRGTQVRYRSRRRWPGPRGASLALQVRLGEALDARDLNDLERFLICRWRLYSPGPATLPARGVPMLATQVEHRSGRPVAPWSGRCTRAWLPRRGCRRRPDRHSRTPHRGLRCGSGHGARSTILLHRHAASRESLKTPRPRPNTPRSTKRPRIVSAAPHPVNPSSSCTATA
jgi:uncharacterized protein YqjF (DUF2071 family)